ncbi:Uncharacterized protein dnl_32040 [Desulfonema limicola]|uniref:Uncharacterized protein n=1 Tax=Desulfonema limicola TaxID=45656 RepID=A0A975B8V1_9BACT|nr:DUF6726 family protein [Desulfonema limicola]QTA80889.1 Uncharacterized protein dnl_32040 [Desulfonema limicola]
MKFIKLLIILLAVMTLNGCVLTKLITVPMRIGGAVISIIPVAGNTAHDAIDKAADQVDDINI